MDITIPIPIAFMKITPYELIYIRNIQPEHLAKEVYT